MLSWLWSHICWCQNILLFRSHCKHAMLMWVQALYCLCVDHRLITVKNRRGSHFVCERLGSASSMRTLWFMSAFVNVMLWYQLSYLRRKWNMNQVFPFRLTYFQKLKSSMKIRCAFFVKVACCAKRWTAVNHLNKPITALRFTILTAK